MKVTVKSIEGALNYEGVNDRGQTLRLSGSKTAVSPMETILIAAATCSSIDVEIFLEKMRQKCRSIEVEVSGTRVDAVPAVFSDMHLHYKIFGDVKDEKAAKAVSMSMDKYCSVSIMLSAAVKISHSYEVISE